MKYLFKTKGANAPFYQLSRFAPSHITYGIIYILYIYYIYTNYYYLDKYTLC